ncbi:AAA family ATPase [Proteobacteria bacterium 005FR1]|nr:AAA family ATPase [Proteobacteria bacterium 005FR1]
MKDSHDMGLLLDSRVPLIVIETYDEKRALDMLLRVANQRKKNVFRWSVTDGLARMSFGPEISLVNYTEPREILEHIKQAATPGIYVLCDFHHYLEGEPRNVRLIKDIAQLHFSVPHTLVFVSHQFDLPADISRYSAVLQLALPSDEEILTIIREEAKQWGEGQQKARVKTDSATLQTLVANLKGLSHSEVRRLARGAIVDDGAITEDDIPAVNKAKFELMDMEGVLSFEYNTERFANVGGLSRLKSWLTERREAFCSSATAADIPKGIMLTGVQGSGKSLAAKSVAGLWGLPLLRLDFASLYNKFFGETERNLREALKLAELMSPCVLWMDEIEKGLSSDQHDNGTSKRVLGTLLTWMAERKERVFIVATSNDITVLPPELVRKGRLDEIFFVDLPDRGTRAEIFAIHLNKRDLSPERFDLSLLSDRAEGFSGAEIEQAVVAAIYTAAARKSELNEQHIVEEIRNTSPLSVVMAEKISALRSWAEGRAVSAD